MNHYKSANGATMSVFHAAKGSTGKCSYLGIPVVEKATAAEIKAAEKKAEAVEDRVLVQRK